MRILHTSDWHLGRSFGPVSLHPDQERFCDWLVEVVAEERVDLVVVAGDVYDRAVPPTESVALLRDVLGRLVARGRPRGGHRRQPRRPRPPLRLRRAHRRRRRGRPGRLPPGRRGRSPSSSTTARSTWSPSPTSTPSWPPTGCGRARRPPSAAPPAGGPRRRRRTARPAFDLWAEAPASGRPPPAPPITTCSPPPSTAARADRRSPRSLAVAHAFVTGGLPSDSERLLTVGGTGEVDASVLRGFSYVALGHLHRPQRVGLGHRALLGHAAALLVLGDPAQAGRARRPRRRGPGRGGGGAGPARPRGRHRPGPPRRPARRPRPRRGRGPLRAGRAHRPRLRRRRQGAPAGPLPARGRGRARPRAGRRGTRALGQPPAGRGWAPSRPRSTSGATCTGRTPPSRSGRCSRRCSPTCAARRRSREAGQPPPHGLRGLPRLGVRRLRRAGGPRAVPRHRPHRLGQDHAVRRARPTPSTGGCPADAPPTSGPTTPRLTSAARWSWSSRWRASATG